MNIELIADTACECGEGPLWHPVEKSVYWTDIPKGRLFRYDTKTGTHATVMEDRPIGGYTLQADGSLLLFRDKGNIVVWRDGKILKTIIDEIPGHEKTRFNDVYANHLGGVYCGTMHGHYYYLAPDGKLTLLRDGYGTPNGMGFSPDNKFLYYNDSGLGKTFRWDYDIATGAISNDIVLHDAKADAANHPGAPDGMCVDSEGFLWVARWGGNGLLRHSPVDGRVVMKIEIPSHRVSSVCFGGDALDTMYVTTAGAFDRPKDPHAGAFFRVTDSGFTGLDRPVSKVGL